MHLRDVRERLLNAQSEVRQTGGKLTLSRTTAGSVPHPGCRQQKLLWPRMSQLVSETWCYLEGVGRPLTVTHFAP